MELTPHASMRQVIPVPATLDDRGFDVLVQGMAAHPDAELLFDARHVRWADPYGMMGLLALGTYLRSRGRKPLLQLPDSAEVNSYLGRMGFLRLAAEPFELHGEARPRRAEASSVLLEITPINSHEDVHAVIEHVMDRAGTILTGRLGYSRVDAGMFSMVLSEVCQNIIEHAEAGGWVGIQTYNWAKRLGRQVVQIGVMDLGIGFRGSLAREHSGRFGDSWSDVAALEAAFVHGTTRFRDPGRGQGLKQIRRRVAGWGGKASVRSGTAKIADVPEWDDAPRLQTGLAEFPGAQILIVLPAK